MLIAQLLQGFGNSGYSIPELPTAPALGDSVFDQLYQKNALPLLMKHYGVDITYTPPGGIGATVKAIVSPEMSREEDNEGHREKKRSTVVAIPRSELSVPQSTATVGVGGEDWNIGQIEAYNRNWNILELVRYESMEYAGDRLRMM